MFWSILRQCREFIPPQYLRDIDRKTDCRFCAPDIDANKSIARPVVIARNRLCLSAIVRAH
jgi:hypothetical protein